MSQQNLELVRAGYRAFNERDPEALKALLHPDVEWYPTLGVLTDERVYRGPQAVCDLVWEEIPRVLEGFRAELLDARDASEDTVIAKARFSGRSRDGGVPVEQVFFQVFRIHEGQTLWMRSHTTEAEALEAAGLSEQAMSQGNVEIVRRLYEGVTARLEIPQELFDPHFELDDVDALEIVRGLEAAQESLREYWDTFEDFHIEVNEVLHADEEHVVTAVQDGGQIRGSDAEVWNCFFHVWTFGDGKIVRLSLHTDKNRALEAAGLRE